MLPAFIAVILVQVALVLRAMGEVRRFLREHSQVRDRDSLDAFKKLARRNMFGAIGVMVVSLVSIAAGMFVVRELRTPGFVVVVAFWLPCLVLGVQLTRLERRTRDLPCDDEALREEYRRVGVAWREKLLPDF